MSSPSSCTRARCPLYLRNFFSESHERTKRVERGTDRGSDSHQIRTLHRRRRFARKHYRASMIFKINHLDVRFRTSLARSRLALVLGDLAILADEHSKGHGARATVVSISVAKVLLTCC